MFRVSGHMKLGFPRVPRDFLPAGCRHYVKARSKNLNAKFTIKTLKPERRNDGLVATISRSTKLDRRNLPHGRLHMKFAWVPEGVTIPDAYLTMTRDGLEVRRLSDEATLHMYPILQLLSTNVASFAPLIRLAIEERIFTEKYLRDLGYGTIINPGVPSTMAPQGLRPPTLHLAHYYPEYACAGTTLEVLFVNLNALCGISGNRRLLIAHPVYAEKPYAFRFNPVCHTSSTGERFLRLTEWSTGELLKHVYHKETRIWEISESRINEKDPRWIPHLQNLGLWPGADPSETVLSTSSSPAEFEELAKYHATKHILSSGLSNTKHGIFETVKDAINTDKDMSDLPPTLVQILVLEALRTFRLCLKSHLKANNSLQSIAQAMIEQRGIPATDHVLARLAVMRSALQDNPGPRYWDLVDERFAKLRDIPQEKVTKIINALLEEDRQKYITYDHGGA